jgi:hypothetical protein
VPLPYGSWNWELTDSQNHKTRGSQISFPEEINKFTKKYSDKYLQIQGHLGYIGEVMKCNFFDHKFLSNNTKISLLEKHNKQQQEIKTKNNKQNLTIYIKTIKITMPLFPVESTLTTNWNLSYTIARAFFTKSFPISSPSFLSGTWERIECHLERKASSCLLWVSLMSWSWTRGNCVLLWNTTWNIVREERIEERRENERGEGDIREREGERVDKEWILT